MSEEPIPFLKACVIITWLVPVIGFLTFGEVIWSLAMRTTGMGAFVDQYIYQMAYCWIALPMVGLLASYRPLKYGVRKFKILTAIPLVFNVIYFGVAIILAISIAQGGF